MHRNLLFFFVGTLLIGAALGGDPNSECKWMRNGYWNADCVRCDGATGDCTNGGVYECFATLKGCCSNNGWEVEDCQARFGGPSADFSVDESSEGDCKFAMSTSRVLNNSVCASICKLNGVDSDAFKKFCLIEKYFRDSRGLNIEKGAKCISHWVYGFADDDENNGDFRGKQASWKKTSTAAECQQYCHETEGCAGFLWNVMGRYHQRCILKNEAQMTYAASIDIESGSWNHKMCNAAMGGAPYNFFKCGDKKTCVWESRNHIAGPASCAQKPKMEEVCKPTISEECGFAMSISELSNTECGVMCTRLGADSDDFNAFCIMEKYFKDYSGLKIEEGARCISQWMYGYTDDDENNGDFRGKQVSWRTTNTAAECQQYCHETQGCVGFAWDVLGAHRQRCILKSAAQKAAAASIDVNSGSWDYKMCNAAMGGAPYNFVKCGAKKTCVWQSYNHITGPAKCGTTRKVEEEVCHGAIKPTTP